MLISIDILGFHYFFHLTSSFEKEDISRKRAKDIVKFSIRINHKEKG